MLRVRGGGSCRGWYMCSMRIRSACLLACRRGAGVSGVRIDSRRCGTCGSDVGVADMRIGGCGGRRLAGSRTVGRVLVCCIGPRRLVLRVSVRLPRRLCRVADGRLPPTSFVRIPCATRHRNQNKAEQADQ